MAGVARWRIFAALCAAPSALAFGLVYALVPESPRFLFVQGRCTEALAVLNRGAAIHGRPALSVRLEDLGPRRVRVQRSFRQHVEVLLAPPLRRTFVPLAGVWTALNFGWYGLQAWLPTIFTNLGLERSAYEDAFFTSAANLPGNLFAMALVDRVGRKSQLAGSTAVSAAVGVCFAFADSQLTALAAACLFNAASVGAWNSLDCLSSESFPTELRATALAVLAASGRLGSTAAQFVNAALVERSVALLLLTSAAAMLLASVLTMLLPLETAGKNRDFLIHFDDILTSK